MQESQLEAEVKKPSKSTKITDQFKQWREEGDYFNHYLSNAIKILFGYKPTDYKVISHENKLVGSIIYW